MSGVHRAFHHHQMLYAKIKMFRAFVGLESMKVHLVVSVDNDWKFTACGQRTRWAGDIRRTRCKVSCKKCLKVIS